MHEKEESARNCSPTWQTHVAKRRNIKKKSSRANKRELSQRRLRITWKKTTKTAAYIKRLWRVDVEDMCSLGRIEILIVGAIEFRRNDNRRG